MSKTLVIKKKYCGPPNSGNGGYTSGLIAAQLSFPVEVTLRIPPPLNKPLALIKEKQSAKLMDGEVLVAEAHQVDFELEVPQPVSFEIAEKATEHFMGFQQSPLPTCFVCGYLRKAGDGLKLHPGKVNETTVAAPWIPYKSLGNKAGIVKTEFIWSALDCPGAWAIQDETQFFLLGRLAAKSILPIKIGQKYVVMGWVIGSEGRKTYAGTAIFDESGQLCAKAKATWIAVKQ